MQYTFHTPTQDVFFRLAGRGLVGSYTQGLSVYRIGGQWRTQLSPSADDLAAADRFYAGGYLHLISPTEAAELIAGGFGPYVDIPGSLGQGSLGSTPLGGLTVGSDLGLGLAPLGLTPLGGLA